MTIETTVLAGVVALAALGGVVAWSYNAGDTNGAKRVQASWDKTMRDADIENSKVRSEGYTLAAEYESRLHELEGRYERTNTNLRRALSGAASCPASGRIGDTVLPAALVDSMFNREPGSAAAPGPATAKPDATVR